jgi:hypothetical protein
MNPCQSNKDPYIVIFPITSDSPASKCVYGMVSAGSFLSLVFVMLKLTGHIAWAWWWTISPLWISMTAVCAIPFVFIVVYIVGLIVQGGPKL